MRLGIGFMAPLGRSRSRRYMFSGDVNMWRSMVVGSRMSRKHEEREDVQRPQAPGASRRGVPTVSTSGAESG